MIFTREIEGFLVVAQYQSLKVASEHLFITVPALSQQMKKLEFAVGVPLLSRHNKGMTLTPAGEVLFEKLEQMKKMEEEALLVTRWAGRRSDTDSSPEETDAALPPSEE